MAPRSKQNDSEEEDRELKSLKHSALITVFSLGHYKFIFDFSSRTRRTSYPNHANSRFLRGSIWCSIRKSSENWRVSFSEARLWLWEDQAFMNSL